MSKKYVYSFEEGNKGMKELLGGKGANLAEMTSLGVPVPPGFTITTEACAEFYELGRKYPQGMLDQVEKKLEELEKKIGKKLGGSEDPLLVSVRSGAAVSMPGMMDTVLNLGLNDESVKGMIKKTGNERFVLDSYRRFIQMFGNVVMGIEHAKFEHILENAKATKGVKLDTKLDADGLKKVIEEYKNAVRKSAGKEFPQEHKEQLKMAIDAVFNSWNNPRAISYRRIHDIKGLIGTAVNVQAMVFGNMGETSGTGVAFTRNPATGENKIYGEFLMNAQGEDVVAGIRTPKPIGELKQIMPKCYKQFMDIAKKIELHYKDMQDMEFTIQEEMLYILQTRSGKRTAAAAVKIAVDLVNEKLITKEEALLRVDPNQLDQLLHPQLDPVARQKSQAIAKGLPASPGAAVGEAVFSAERAYELAEEGHDVILVRTETSPEDIEGMNAAKGILTARGGMTSHAAVVARGMGKCCIAGCEDIFVDEKNKQFKAKDIIIREGDFITLDGSAGEAYEGRIPVVEAKLSGDFAILMKWADSVRKLGVRTNADTPKDAETAIRFGAEGIGLTRTEHMFFEGSRIMAMREMILSDSLEGRKKALAKLLPYQKKDFIGIFKAMGKRPVTIRLLDPPLHEFLPREEKDIKELANEMKVSVEKLKEKISELHEFNPMLGHRGCRLGIKYPEITEMQAQAIFEAAAETGGIAEVMVPLVGDVKELVNQKEVISKVAEDVAKKTGKKVKYKIGTMIEVPRGAVTADEIAKEAEFFSFGTNDLTQMGCGFSRDDAGKFLKDYVELGIYEKDPFQSLDQSGVGKLVEIAVKLGKSVNPGIKLGICGEHGGDPSSIEFFHKAGLTYVSASPYRIPIARLAAAHAVLKSKKEQR